MTPTHDVDQAYARFVSIVGTPLDEPLPDLVETIEHDGCAYQLATDRHKGCKPVDVCPAGYRVYRKWTGGGHHHAWEDKS